MLTAEIQRLRREMESSAAAAERQRESLHEKLTAMDRDHQTALQQAKHDHEEEVTRLTNTQVIRQHSVSAYAVYLLFIYLFIYYE